MAWLLVVVAGLLETGFAVCLKLSHGFTRLWPTIAFCIFALGSFGLLTLSLRKLDVGHVTGRNFLHGGIDFRLRQPERRR